MSDIPILETDRLILRPHLLSDYADCLALWSAPNTVRFIGGKVQSEQEVWFRLLRYAGMWALLGFGFWVFEEKATGRYVGEGGLLDARRGIAALDGKPEIGWVLTPDAGGKGYATEAVRAVTRWADSVLKVPVTACIIEPENVASIGVAAKCGYAEASRAQRGDTNFIVYERMRVS